MMKNPVLITILITLLSSCYSIKQASNQVRIGICTDANLTMMQDATFRITTFIDEMKVKNPDFIIELGDFAKVSDTDFYKIWDSFPWDKFHVIGDHEMDGGFSNELVLERRMMKSAYYSFDKCGFHFIVLDSNDNKNKAVKDSVPYIGSQQIEWLKNDLFKAGYPVVIFSHQCLISYQGAEGAFGIENGKQVVEIIGDYNSSNPKKRVIACFNGHSHWDYAEKINDIWYIQMNSMSFNWPEESNEEKRNSTNVDKNKTLNDTATFKDPLYATVLISTKGWIKILGKKSEWIGPTPFELGCPQKMKKYIHPAITERTLKFKPNKPGDLNY